MEEFNKILEEYRGNYIQFLTTGIPEYKTAYQRAQDIIEKLLQEKQEQVLKEKKDMKHFVESYKRDNEELTSLYDAGTSMKKDAQEIQDEYITSKNRYSEFTKKPEIPAKVDLTNGYTILLRIGIIFIILPVLFFLGYFLGVSSPTQTITTLASPQLVALSP